MSALAGKVAIVTGSARGIGAASALALARHGANVVVHDRDEDAECETLLAETANSIKALGNKAVIVTGDITLKSTALDLVAAAQSLATDGKTVDIVVSNAGMTHSCTIESLTMQDFENVMRTNVWAGLQLLQVSKPALPRGGRFIWIGSIAAQFGAAGEAPYAASKGALRSLAASICAEWAAEAGVPVHVVEPGPVNTRLLAATSQAAVGQYQEMVERLLEPADVAAVVALLAGEAAAFVNGVSVPVNKSLWRY